MPYILRVSASIEKLIIKEIKADISLFLPSWNHSIPLLKKIKKKNRKKYPNLTLTNIKMPLTTLKVQLKLKHDFNSSQFSVNLN